MGAPRASELVAAISPEVGTLGRVWEIDEANEFLESRIGAECIKTRARPAILIAGLRVLHKQS